MHTGFISVGVVCVVLYFYLCGDVIVKTVLEEEGSHSLLQVLGDTHLSTTPLCQKYSSHNFAELVRLGLAFRQNMLNSNQAAL